MKIYKQRGAEKEGGKHIDPELLTYAEAAALLRISDRKVRYMVERDEIPHVRFGKSVRFPRDVLRQWIVAKTVGGQPGAGKAAMASDDLAA